MTLTDNHKFLLIASLVSVVYFGLLFSGLIQNSKSVLIGAAVELFTIPMILLQLGIIVYTLNWFFIKKNQPSVQTIIPLIISIVLVVCIFFLFLG